MGKFYGDPFFTARCAHDDCETIFMRGSAGASVISPAGLPLRGAGEMHGRESPAPPRHCVATITR